MNTVILDTGPLGIVTNPKASTINEACRGWVRNLLVNGIRIIVPEIADYELRRELLRADKPDGLTRLDVFNTTRGPDYLPITTPIMREAARLWAEARKRGIAGASDPALDGDMILIAQARSLGLPDGDAIIATKNVDDFLPFFPAALWENITL
jgi:predicted nucleic acid-binding protein